MNGALRPCVAAALAVAGLLAAPAHAAYVVDNYVGYAHSVNTGDNQAITPNNGGKGIAGDVQFVFQTFRQPTGSNTITLNNSHSGTVIRTNSLSTGTAIPTVLWRKVLTGSEGNPTGTVTAGASASQTHSAAIFTVRGIDTTGGVLATAQGVFTTTTDLGSEQQASFPSMTISEDNAFVVLACRLSGVSAGATISDSNFVLLGYDSSDLGNDQSVAVWTWQQTTATNISAGTIVWEGQASAVNQGCLMAAFPTVAEAEPPAFTLAPIVTGRTADTYTISYTADANADDLYCGAWLVGATPPSAAAIKAGTGARGTATESTTGSADTVDLEVTDTPVHPLYTLYCVLEGEGGFSDVEELEEEFLAPPSGFSFTQLAMLAEGSWVAEKLNPALPNALEDGDVMVVATTTTPAGFSVTQHADGYISLAPPADETPQTVQYCAYDVSANAYITLCPRNLRINWPTPTCDLPPVTPIPLVYKEGVVYKEGEAIPYLLHFVTDLDCHVDTGEGLIGSINETPPAGVAFNGLALEEDGTSPEELAGTDITARLASEVTGLYAEVPLKLFVVGAQEVPSTCGAGLSALDCATDLFDLFVNSQIILQCSGVSAGEIISTTPAAEASVEPDVLGATDPDTVVIAASRGPCGYNYYRRRR